VEPDGIQVHQDQPSPTESGNSVELGGIRSAREQAAALLHALVDAGYAGKSLPNGSLFALHVKLCKEAGWLPRGWLAIGRALRRMGLRKAKLWCASEDGPELVTYYEIAAPAGNVVDLKRA
jgi:hypothetical protein